MACDSLYAAWLKVHYPYELYVTMLKLYDEKKNTDKISAIISEMKRYKNISLTAGRFGQDNRDWVVDKEHHAISQSLSSIRYMSKKAAQDLQKLGTNSYSTFTDVLRDMQMNTCLDTRQIGILIELNYFEQFGKSGKLMKVYNEFFEGEKKLTKTVKSYEARLENCRNFEKSLNDADLPIQQRLISELNNVGLCLSADNSSPSDLYFVRAVDAKYGVKCTLYSVKRGTTGIVRFRKNDFAKHSFKEGDCIILEKFNKSPKYSYRGGERVELPGVDFWAQQYKVINAPA
jgi:DNA polymerase III alpha subunit